MKKDKETSLFSLFASFFRIGAFTFGGGLSMLPLLKKECIENHSWATEDEMLNYFAIGQCTPGIIAVNTATFIGHKQRGVLGGLAATFGVILPGFLIILLLATVFSRFADSIYLVKAFAGIRVAVVAIIFSAVVDIAKKSIKSISTAVVGLAAVLLQVLFGISPVYIVLGTLLIGIAVWRFGK